MITVKLTGVKEMVADLKKLREKAVPYAIKNALNVAAFEARTIWQGEIRKSFVNRNQYTARSIRVEQASITKLQAKVGSVADYMGKQETGGTVKGRGAHKLIPEAAAAGQAPGNRRTKMVRGRFYIGALQVAHPTAHGGRRQKNAIAIAVARKTGKNVVLLTRPSGGKGLFILGGGKRSLKMRMLWDVSRKSVHVHAEPTLERALTALKPKLEHMMSAALTQQMQRFSIGK